MRPPGINNNGEDYKDERLEFISERLKKYDVVCFQEMFKEFSSRQSRLVNSMAALNFSSFSLPVSPSFFSFQLVGSGLLTASKPPISYQKFMSFDEAAGVDKLAEKGLQYSKITLEGGRNLHLFNLHL